MSPPAPGPVTGRREDRRKDQAIESLRGLAILLMVTGHVIGSDASRGLRVADESVWRYLSVGLEDIRMPLFTVISGFVYAMRPVSDVTGVPGLVRAKARRLLLPLVTVGVVQFFVEFELPGTNFKPHLDGFWRIFVYPFEHLWFLQAIFLVFVVAGFAGAARWMTTGRRTVTLIAVSAALFLVVPVPQRCDVFSVGGLLRLLPFFLIGYALHRFPPPVRWLVWVIPALAVSYSVRLSTVLHAWEPAEITDRAIATAVGVTAVLLLFFARNRIRWRPLAWIGGFAFGIYLLHVFGTAAARMGMHLAGVTLSVPVFAVSLACGIAAPIAVQLVFRRSRMVQTAVFGEKWARRRSPTTTDAVPQVPQRLTD